MRVLIIWALYFLLVLSSPMCTGNARMYVSIDQPVNQSIYLLFTHLITNNQSFSMVS